MNKLQEKLADAALRMDRVLILAGALVEPDSPCDDLDEFIDYDCDVEDIQRLFPHAPANVIDPGDKLLSEDFCEWLHDSSTFGYLVKFATPVMKRITKTARSFSWGHYNTRWEYGETLDAVVEKGLAWANEIRAKEDKAQGGAA